MFALPPDPDPVMVNVNPAVYDYADSLMSDAVEVSEANMPPGPCAGTDVYVYDDAQGSSTRARGNLPGCRVFFTRTWRNDVWSIYTDRSYGLRDRRDTLSMLCTGATHELWHNRGRGHEPAPSVMTEYLEDATVPGYCRAWARKLLPRRHRA